MVVPRVAVIGDVGGHLDALTTELARLGADPAGRLPDGLTVIQVGDLVHRGPDSDGVVDLVDRYLREQPGQWLQLAGNHEAQYLRRPAFDWPETISTGSAATLRRWWVDGQLLVAVAVTAPAESFVITHAGLTVRFWRDQLDGVRNAVATVQAANGLARLDDDIVFRSGHMLSGRKIDPGAGPLWAAAATELLPGWLGTVLPFSQVHGHSSLTGRDVDPMIMARTTVDAESGHETTRLDGGRIIGVDPDHGRAPTRQWESFVITAGVATT